MNRRACLKTGIGAATGLLAAGFGKANPGHTFRLNYAPHFGMFRHHAGDDVVDQLRFMHREGFRALEDNQMSKRTLEEQSRIAREMERLRMQMGVFSASGSFTKVTFASDKKEDRDEILRQMRHAVELARRVRATWCTVVPGRFDERLEWDYQTSNMIENLKRCTDILEPAGLVMVIEPLNTWRDHPGLFLTKIPQAYMICRAVASPSCKILFDIYHQQIMEGNLIPNIERAWKEIGYFQIGDNPGRKEPTTGEINFRNVLRYIHSRGWTGILGMEHGNFGSGREGERAVIDAYRQCDDF